MTNTNTKDYQRLYEQISQGLPQDKTLAALDHNDLRAIIHCAEKEGFTRGRKHGIEYGEAKGQEDGKKEVHKTVEETITKEVMVLIKFGMATHKYCDQHYKGKIKILGYRMRYSPNCSKAIFIIDAPTDLDFEFSKMLDNFETIAKEQGALIDSNFVNENADKKIDHELIIKDFPTPIKLAA